jgi:hypothetical protein
MINAAESAVVHQDASTSEGDDVIRGKRFVAVMEGEWRIRTKAVIQVPVLVVVRAGQELSVASLPGLVRE